MKKRVVHLMRARMSRLLRRIAIGALASGWLVSLANQPAQAVMFEVLSGDKAATAEFTVVSGNLQVVLTNTSAADVLVPMDVLTAVFFDIAENPTLTRISALLTSGSSVFYDPDGQPPGGDVGGEWAYRSGLVGAPLGATQGISSTGVGLFGPADRFPGSDLAPPENVDGLQYGILSAGDISATGNGGITGSGGLIKNSVTFTLGGWTGQLEDIRYVSFLYGTSLATIPEPETFGMLAVGLGLMGWIGRRSKRNARR